MRTNLALFNDAHLLKTPFGTLRYDGQAGAAGITLIDQSEGAERAFIQGLYPSLRRQGLAAYQVPRLVRFMKQ